MALWEMILLDFQSLHGHSTADAHSAVKFCFVDLLSVGAALSEVVMILGKRYRIACALGGLRCLSLLVALDSDITDVQH